MVLKLGNRHLVRKPLGTALCPSLFHGTTKTVEETGTELLTVAAAEWATSENVAVGCALFSDLSRGRVALVG